MLSNTIIRIGVVMDILHGSVFRQVVGALPAITFAIFLAGCSAADDGSSDAASTDAASGGSSGVQLMAELLVVQPVDLPVFLILTVFRWGQKRLILKLEMSSG